MALLLSCAPIIYSFWTKFRPSVFTWLTFSWRSSSSAPRRILSKENSTPFNKGNSLANLHSGGGDSSVRDVKTWCLVRVSWEGVETANEPLDLSHGTNSGETDSVWHANCPESLTGTAEPAWCKLRHPNSAQTLDSARPQSGQKDPLDTLSETPWLSIAITIAAILGYALYQYFSPSPIQGLEAHLPVVGIQSRLFPWARATLASFAESKAWAFASYKTHSRHNQPYILPSLDRGPVVIIPPAQTKALYRGSEDVLDAHATQNDTIQTKWTIPDQEVTNNSAIHINVIRRQMTRNLDHLVPVLAKEVQRAVERSWGTRSSEWKTVAVWESCLEIVAAAGNAAFCGTELCHNPEFLAALQRHGASVLGGSMVISAAPRPLKPIVGSIIRQQRLDETAKAKNDPSSSWDPPKDALQWVIDECYEPGQPSQLAPERVALRLLILNMVSLHSTSFTVQNLVLDLASTDPELNVIGTLREECATVLEESGGTWTAEAVKKLRFLDWAIRESIRLTPFGNIGLPRTVVHPTGLPLQNPPLTLPQGTILALALGPAHRDGTLYPRPNDFDAFRFARAPSSRGLRGSGSGSSGTDQTSAVTPDDKFLGFGFGRHACPGRFFAVAEIKLLVARMLLEYEIGHIKERPRDRPLMSLNYPAAGAVVRVRRRSRVK
ncbi:cytochrome P450 [Aspergillus carlsbadensis]|nr:cytochrome P450 [Aspergillus carlsbadensis]